MDANNETPYNEDIRAAVRYLYGKGIIETDKDIADKVNLSKGTISPYLNGKEKASANFRTKFEQSFGLNLSDFASNVDERNRVLPLGAISITVADYIRRLEYYNDTLSNAINQGLAQLKTNLKEGQEDITEQIAASTKALGKLMTDHKNEILSAQTEARGTRQKKERVNGKGKVRP